MTQIPFAKSNGFLSVEVQLNYAADVFLVDEINYQRYCSNKQFEYFGGHFKKTPVRISVKGTGRWYLIVKGGGGQYKYRWIHP